MKCIACEMEHKEFFSFGDVKWPLCRYHTRGAKSWFKQRDSQQEYWKRAK